LLGRDDDWRGASRHDCQLRATGQDHHQPQRLVVHRGTDSDGDATGSRRFRCGRDHHRAEVFRLAGCNYRYTINPQYISAKPLPDKTTVVFTVTGGDQDQIGNFTIDTDGMATFDRETMISGPEGADLRATVTQVISGR
jgi:hypothetical protein